MPSKLEMPKWASVNDFFNNRFENGDSTKIKYLLYYL